jgi:hypothetical protein
VVLLGALTRAQRAAAPGPHRGERQAALEAEGRAPPAALHDQFGRRAGGTSVIGQLPYLLVVWLACNSKTQ